jgi:hypothetical protein
MRLSIFAVLHQFLVAGVVLFLNVAICILRYFHNLATNHVSEIRLSIVSHRTETGKK